MGADYPRGPSSVTSNQADDMGAAAAAPSDDLQGGGTATDTGLLSVRHECSRAFSGARGLSQHRRRAHPTEYHAENVPVARNINSSSVTFSRVTLSWRGLMAHTSAETLYSDLALGWQVPSLLSAVTCERSLWIWQIFHL